jgi:hypothetical protein
MNRCVIVVEFPLGREKSLPAWLMRVFSFWFDEISSLASRREQCATAIAFVAS